MKKLILIPVGVLLIGTNGACSTDSSTGFATNKIKPSYSADVDAFKSGDTFISAILDEEDDTFSHVHLDGSDTITAATDKDPSLALPYDSALQIYSTTLDKVTDRSTVTFSLNRQSGSAPASVVTLPGAVAFSAPLGTGGAMPTIDYGDGTGSVDFTWSNSVSGASVAVTGFPSCDDGAVQFSTTQTNGPDNGALTVPMSTLIVSAPPAGGQCVTLRFTRTVNGKLDPALAQDGQITATRKDYLKVVIMPKAP